MTKLPDLVVAGLLSPWEPYSGIDDAISAIEQFADGKGRTWKPLAATNGSDGGPQTALARQVLRAQNEVLFRLVKDSPERAPADAMRHLLGPRGPISGTLNKVYARLVRVDMYSYRFSEQNNNVLDVRDFGVGLPQHHTLDIFEPLRRDWALVDHLQGQPSYRYAPYTLIATRQEDEPVALAIIRRMHGPRYFVLVDSKGDLPVLPDMEERFAVGTLVRHLKYEAPLYNGFKENSVQGVLDRTLPGMRFPVATYYHDLISGKTHSRLAIGSERRLQEWIGRGKANVTTHRATVEDFTCPVHRYNFFGSVDDLRHHCHPMESVLFVLNGQTIATGPCSTPAQMAIVDVSALSREQLQRLRSDLEWRRTLAGSLLNAEHRDRYSAEAMAVPAE